MGRGQGLRVNGGFGKFGFEKSLVVVPGSFGGTVGKPGQIFGILDRLSILASVLRGFCGQGEVKALDWLTAFKRQLRSDTSFIFEAGDLMTARAAIMPDPFLAFLF